MKARRKVKTAIYSALLASLLGLTIVAFLLAGHSRQEISIYCEGTTNGVVGLTNGNWTIYCVSNQSANSFAYVGTKIELRTENGWTVDPDLKPTEIGGWLAPPYRMWHDGTGTLPAGGTFHFFINAPADGPRWKASMRFFRILPSTVPAALTGNPSTVAAVGEAVGNILDRPRYYDVQVPNNSN